MKAWTAALVSTAALVIACGGSPSNAGGSTPPPPPSAGGSHGACPPDNISPTNPGVINRYCFGTAVANVTINGANKTLRGGTCTTVGSDFVVNVGTVTSHEFQGTRPDFVSVNSPVGGGSQNTGATVILDGKMYGYSGRIGGTVTFANGGKSLHFDGAADNGDKATIDVTC